MRLIEVTRANSDNYNGPMLIVADKLLGMQRVRNGRGTYTCCSPQCQTLTPKTARRPAGLQGSTWSRHRRTSRRCSTAGDTSTAGSPACTIKPVWYYAAVA